jgi:hypothetical protein
MKTVAATEAKNRFGAIIDDAQREPIVIRRQDRDVAVVLSLFCIPALPPDCGQPVSPGGHDRNSLQGRGRRGGISKPRPLASP